MKKTMKLKSKLGPLCAGSAADLLFSGLTQRQLAEMCKRHGIPVAKYKETLIERLVDYVEQNKLPVVVSIG